MTRVKAGVWGYSVEVEAEEECGRGVVTTRSHHCVPVPVLDPSEARTPVQDGSPCSRPRHVSRRSPYVPCPLGGRSNDEGIGEDCGGGRGEATVVVLFSS